jgi:hypothetical protein
VIAARERFGRRMLRWTCNPLAFVDESGVNLSQTRAQAWAPRGERVTDHIPGRRETYSVIAALRSTGIVAPMMPPGAMNTDALLAWVNQVLAPHLRRGDIVVWDNVGMRAMRQSDRSHRRRCKPHLRARSQPYRRHRPQGRTMSTSRRRRDQRFTSQVALSAPHDE